MNINHFYAFKMFCSDSYNKNVRWPLRELIGQLNHKETKLLVWRKSHRLTNLVYKLFHVPHGTCRYACRRCTMELNSPVQAVYFEKYDLYACIRCNQWLENPCTDSTCSICIDAPAGLPQECVA